MRQFLICIVIVLLCASCSFPNRNPTPTLPVADAVATTLAMIPPTITARPLPTVVPTATPFDLRGLYCEYQFCIGHPLDMAFYDVNAVISNQGTPSAYSQGNLAAYNANLFLFVIWQIAPGASDPQFLLDTIIDADVDTRVGNLEVKLIRDMNVIYTPITSTATSVLPHGSAAAWTCGDRVFAWKTYTPDETSAPGLFEEALRRFNCNR